MHITYLCPKHSDWVYNNPQQAAYYLMRNDMQGSLLYQSGCYSDAIPYLGCAFDIAAILLELEEGSNEALIDTVKALTATLATAYQRLQRTDYQQAINTRASMLLMAVASCQENKRQGFPGDAPGVTTNRAQLSPKSS